MSIIEKIFGMGNIYTLFSAKLDSLSLRQHMLDFVVNILGPCCVFYSISLELCPVN